MTVLSNLVRAHDTGFVAADAERDLRRMRRDRVWRQLWSRLWRSTGYGTELTSFDEVAATLGATARHDLGLQHIDLDTIVGSVGRSREFDSCFRPGPTIDGRRWESLDRAMRSGQSLPPITVYRIGGGHYVQDGHHRVSVAHAVGMRTIDAFVTDVMTAPQYVAACVC
jgi:hypothetical protein